MKKYVIVGAGAAGVSAAEAIRAQDAAGEILLLSCEAQPPYVRPLLTKTMFAARLTPDVPLYSAPWYRERRIELRLGTRAQRLELEEKRLWVDGEAIPYDKCILATGGENFIPPFQGCDKAGIFTVRRVEDILRIKRAATLSRRAVIIGGGVIGMECAIELRRYGLDVTILEAMEYLMPRQLARETSDLFCGAVSSLAIHTNIKIQCILGGETVSGVELSDGRRFPCELLIVSCGSRASIALAQEAGIATGRSILVNERMETSVPDVYACGDCAEYAGVNACLWSQSRGEGRVAGTNAAGGDARYAGCDMSLLLNCDGVALFALGDQGQIPSEDLRCERSDEAPGDGERFLVNPRRALHYERRVYRGGRLVGAALVGDLTRMSALKRELLAAREG